MKLYINIKKMIFEEDNIEHEIILKVRDKEFDGYDLTIELNSNNKFVKDTEKVEYEIDEKGRHTDRIKKKVFVVTEQKTWWSYPLYEIINNEIVSFDYTKYNYFTGTKRRMMIAAKINLLYNPPSEAKIQRKTLKKILDHLGIVDDKFDKYNQKVEAIINKNPKRKY